MCSGEWGASPQAWLPKGGATADTCEGFGCQEYFGVCSEVLDVGRFLFPCSGLGGWHGEGGVGGEVLEASFGPEVSRATSQDRYGLLFSQPAVAIRGFAIWLVTALDG